MLWEDDWVSQQQPLPCGLELNAIQPPLLSVRGWRDPVTANVLKRNPTEETLLDKPLQREAGLRQGHADSCLCANREAAVLKEKPSTAG